MSFHQRRGSVRVLLLIALMLVGAPVFAQTPRIVQLAGSNDTTFALREDGSVIGWGRGDNGQCAMQKVLINQWIFMCRPITSREKSCHLRKPITRGRKNRRVCRNCDCAGTGARTVSANRRKGKVGKLHDAELSRP